MIHDALVRAGLLAAVLAVALGQGCSCDADAEHGGQHAGGGASSGGAGGHAGSPGGQGGEGAAGAGGAVAGPCEDPTVGSCVACHIQPWGEARQVVGPGGDFDRTSHHVIGSVQDEDCESCHCLADHMQGTVRLKDADLGATLIHTYDEAAPASVEPFCLSCHDGDGAQALATPDQPFSDGLSPRDIAGGGRWSQAAHAQLGYALNQGKPLSCLGDGITSGCHGNAHGSDNIKLLAGDAVGDSIELQCFRCHSDGKVINHSLSDNRPGGYVSADDIEEAFTKPTVHDLGAHFSVGGQLYTLQCTTCHNPHVATGTYWDAALGVSPVTRPDFADPVTNPRAMGNEAWGDEPGEKMSDFAALGLGTGGWYFSVARGGLVAWDQAAVYQPPKSGNGASFELPGDVLPDFTTLCLDCHSERMSDAVPPVNWGQGITCTDNSIDPPNQRVECGAQHGLAPAGLPLYVSDAGTAGAWGSSGNPDVLFQMNYVTRGRHNGHFMRWPYETADRAAGINFVLSCTDCHEAHGSARGGMIRERFNVNAQGGCGSGANGQNCTDGGNWNNFCNACHYYYGGQHAGMSCGNASCHEANSIHRIIHTVDSGSATQLMLTAAGNEGAYQRPTFTPEIVTVSGSEGSSELTVSFATGAYGHADLSGDLQVGDFWLFDIGADNPRTVTAVQHNAGDSSATLTMSAPLVAQDLGNDLLAARPSEIWCWYDGGYVNAATGVIGPQPVSAGPWPVPIDSP